MRKKLKPLADYMAPVESHSPIPCLQAAISMQQLLTRLFFARGNAKTDGGLDSALNPRP